MLAVFVVAPQILTTQNGYQVQISMIIIDHVRTNKLEGNLDLQQRELSEL